MNIFITLKKREEDTIPSTHFNMKSTWYYRDMQCKMYLLNLSVLLIVGGGCGGGRGECVHWQRESFVTNRQRWIFVALLGIDFLLKAFGVILLVATIKGNKRSIPHTRTITHSAQIMGKAPQKTTICIFLFSNSVQFIEGQRYNTNCFLHFSISIMIYLQCTFFFQLSRPVTGY